MDRDQNGRELDPIASDPIASETADAWLEAVLEEELGGVQPPSSHALRQCRPEDRERAGARVAVAEPRRSWAATMRVAALVTIGCGAVTMVATRNWWRIPATESEPGGVQAGDAAVAVGGGGDARVGSHVQGPGPGGGPASGGGPGAVQGQGPGSAGVQGGRPGPGTKPPGTKPPGTMPPGTKPSDPNAPPGSVTGGPGAGPVAGPGAGPVAGPGAGPVAGPGAGPVAGPGAGLLGLATGPNSTGDWEPGSWSGVRVDSGRLAGLGRKAEQPKTTAEFDALCARAVAIRCVEIPGSPDRPVVASYETDAAVLGRWRQAMTASVDARIKERELREGLAIQLLFKDGTHHRMQAWIGAPSVFRSNRAGPIYTIPSPALCELVEAQLRKIRRNQERATTVEGLAGLRSDRGAIALKVASAQDVEALARFRLEALRLLPGSDLSLEVMQALGQSAATRNLRSLRIDSGHLTQAGLAALVTRWTYLAELHLRELDGGCDGSALAALVGSSVQRLKLSNCVGFEADALRAMVGLPLRQVIVDKPSAGLREFLPQMIRSLPRLEIVRLDEFGTADKELLDSLAESKLWSIGLVHCRGITPEAVERLLQTPRLRSLDLSGTDFSEACLEPLSKATKLRSLRLEAVYVPGPEFQKIKPMIPNCATYFTAGLWMGLRRKQ